MPPDSCQLLNGLPPVIGSKPLVLILGSFPSRLSLESGQYYSNPQNQFWKVMENLLAIDSTLPYPRRLELMLEHRLALWDAIGSCSRRGSADSRIMNGSCNDIGRLLESRPGIRVIACNGSASARFVEKKPLPATIPFLRLPSTSPANARLLLGEKIRAWSAILPYLDK